MQRKGFKYINKRFWLGCCKLFGCLVLLILVVQLIFKFNLLFGTYSYDPHSDKPASWVSTTAPETFVMQYLRQQMAQNATYPPNAVSKIVSLEPTKVTLATYTDWQTGADVSITIRYQDGSIRFEDFGLSSQSSQGSEFGPFAFSYGAVFGSLTNCQEYEPFKSSCTPP